MLAPITLYPDEVLVQVLMAAAYPLEIVRAYRWIQASLNLTGDQLAAALAFAITAASCPASPNQLQARVGGFFAKEALKPKNGSRTALGIARKNQGRLSPASVC
jgi:hypothetical protein